MTPQLGPRTEKRDSFTRLLGHLMKGTEKGCVMNQNDAQGAGDTVHQDAAEADTLDDRSAQDRKVQIAEMLAREQDPEHQGRVAKADLAFARRAKAEEEVGQNKVTLQNAPAKGDIKNLKDARAEVAHAESELLDADENIKELRGDYYGGIARPTMKLPKMTPQETQEERRARRHQMCLDAGLKLPDNDYGQMPRGIGRVAKMEGVTRQAFAEDVKAHINRLHQR